MSTIFKSEIERGIVSVYLDDMLTHSDAVKDHEKDVKQTIKRLQENSVKAKVTKCEIATKKVVF